MRLTVRVRLTLLYTALFVACGAIVVAITYVLVADSLSVNPKPSTPALSDICKEALKNPSSTDAAMKSKCENAYKEGVDAGVRSQRDAVLDDLLRYSLTTLGAVTVLSALAGWIVAGRVLRPVHRITEAARAASEHNLGGRLSLAGPRDELRELADTFDAMLDRLEKAFDGQRLFIANASHELRTPLTVMRTTVDVVLAKPAPTPAELVEMGGDVRAAIERAEGLIEAMLTLARNQSGLAVREPVDLATVAEDALEMLPAGGHRVHHLLEPAPTSGDPVLLERLAANLLDNAVRYNVDGGEVRVMTSTVDGRAVLMVANTGPAVPAQAIGTLFEPFRRVGERRTGDGFGLGLAIVAAIASVHDGAVCAEPVDGGGLRVTLTLPFAAAP